MFNKIQLDSVGWNNYGAYTCDLFYIVDGSSIIPTPTIISRQQGAQESTITYKDSLLGDNKSYKSNADVIYDKSWYPIINKNKPINLDLLFHGEDSVSVMLGGVFFNKVLNDLIDVIKITILPSNTCGCLDDVFTVKTASPKIQSFNIAIDFLVRDPLGLHNHLYIPHRSKLRTSQMVTYDTTTDKLVPHIPPNTPVDNNCLAIWGGTINLVNEIVAECNEYTKWRNN